jgi:pimeloyl-ACP methyl ester carboxylesterase
MTTPFRRRPRTAGPAGPRPDNPRSSVRRSIGPVAVVSAAVALLTVVGGVPADAQQPATGHEAARTASAPLNPATEAAAQVAAVATPKLSWKSCRGKPRYDCARVQVPLDYDEPQGATVSLSLARLPATDQAHQVGSLFTNPGGPGSGVQDVLSGGVDSLYTRQVRAKFDIVSFDPRGVADSTGLQCFDTTTAAEKARPAFDFPFTPKEEREWLRTGRSYSQACVRRAGAVIDHLSTANVARDMDVLRRAVGDKQLTYAGFSYGTFLGATYANLFPDKVRALIIDGVVDPISWTTGRGDQASTVPLYTRLGSDQGSSETFAQFLALCKQGGENCAFSAGDPARRFAALTARLRRSGPIALPDGQGGTVPVDYQRVVFGVAQVLYIPTAWPALARFLNGLDTGRLAEAAAALGELSPPAPPAGGRYVQVREAELGIPCSDAANPTSEATWAKSAREADQRYPYFGRAWAWQVSGCLGWPGHDDDRYTGPFDTPTAHPVLVMSTRYDPVTRYQDAVSTSRILPGSRLLTVNGWGHTAAGRSACADRHAAAYLLTGVLPPAGTVCAPDEVPFAAAPRGSGVNRARRDRPANDKNGAF